jgi:hypothetical protein
MESLCRQRAVFYPLESWRLLAEAEMWHHKAQEEAARSVERCTADSAMAAQKASRPRPEPGAHGLKRNASKPEPCRPAWLALPDHA